MNILYLLAGGKRWLLFGLAIVSWLAAPQRAAAQAGPPTWQKDFNLQQDTGDSAFLSATATDGQGNVYLAGSFTGAVRLDTIQLRSKGGLDLFVAKLNSATGKIIWAKRAGSLGNDGANDLVVLGNSVYVAGVFSSTISFDDLELQGSADGNGFLVKLTDTGPTTTAEWGLPIVGQNKTSVFNLAVSGQNLYVNGEYKKAVPVGTTPPTLPGSDIGTFIAKVTDAGTTGRLEWMKEVAKVGQVGLVDLAVVGNQVYLAGNVKANAELDTIRVNISNSFGFEIFVAKLTDTGSTARFTWVQQVGTYHYINASALAVQGNAVYLAGTLSDVTTFGTLPPQVPSGTNSRLDGFVAKLTDAGPTASFNWVVATSSSEDESAQDLAVVGNTVYVSGHFREEGKFGSTTLQSVNYFTYPFVAAITDDGSSGRFIWAKSNSSINGSLSALLPTSAGLYLGIFSQVRTGRVTYDSRASLGLLAYRSPLATAQPAALPLGLFPNPAHGTVAVALPPGFGPGRPVLTLFDALGQVVRVMPAAASLAPASVQVDLTGLALGVYVVRIAGAEKVATSRLVVE